MKPDLLDLCFILQNTEIVSALNRSCQNRDAGMVKQSETNGNERQRRVETGSYRPLQVELGVW